MKDSNIYLLFSIDKIKYAIDFNHVREISSGPKLTTVPNAPTHTMGVFNLRGSIVPLLNGSELLGKGSTPRMEYIIILNISKKYVGITVDKIDVVKNTFAKISINNHVIFHKGAEISILGELMQDNFSVPILDVEQWIGKKLDY